MASTGPTLRTAAMSCRVQPSLFTPSTHIAAVSSTTQTKPSSTRSQLQHARYSSTSASSTSSPASTSPICGEKLDWNSYFKLRKRRRYFQLGSSVGTTLAATVGGIQVLTMQDVEPLVGQIPLDPFITLGLMTTGFGAIGWLMGPPVGAGIFNLLNGKHKADIAAKEKEFYARVKKYRVDPSASSMANPVPDYYGEKIGSVQGYRQWLKDQRAFNKKREVFVK